ncbi:related to acid sphingomyelinase [Ceraceosorus bombacis]|uniref:Related to acid sphingomyelinase n=1 Tax=Ceraceosorus bombacis TaxID=401625 RepID=A0A0P1BAR8_9BASI|nr:related to acid sphingomyelinase [Ceraceosorus bombacis]
MWPTSAPLNASFWASVTDEMLARPSLIDAFRTRQGRNSPRTKPFPSDEARQAQVCYMRSGSSVTGQMCPQGYGSVQS